MRRQNLPRYKHVMLAVLFLWGLGDSAPVVYFAEQVKTSLWSIWAQQHAQYT